jgi:alpha-D-xyloside xylohydrolase
MNLPSAFRLSLAGTLLLPVALFAAQAPHSTHQRDGITVSANGMQVRLQVMSADIVHVEAGPAEAFAQSGPAKAGDIAMVIAQPQASGWQQKRGPHSTLLITPHVTAAIDDDTLQVSFTDTATGQPILAEAARSFTATTQPGLQSTSVQQTWQAQDESLYGLGQQQLGTLDLKGLSMELWQHNTRVFVPFLVSSRGYGILWNNRSYSRFGDLRPFEPIPAYSLFDSEGHAGGLTLTFPGTHEKPESTPSLRVAFSPTSEHHTAPDREWNGSVLAPQTGEYVLHANSNGGIKVYFDGHLVMDHWRQAWLAADDEARVSLIAGKHYTLRIVTDGEQQSRLSFDWKTPSASQNTSLWSEVAPTSDYYFVYGPKLDDVVAGYRQLTGQASMMPEWVFGLWQSRQRYETQQQSLDVVDQFRARRIPFDNIVQDWQYWRPDAWGSHAFDPTRFPHPQQWIDAIHAQHANLMISVWGKFNPNTANAQEMQAHGYLFQPDLREGIKDWIGYPYTFYDAFNPGARKLFWSQMNTALFSKGIDAWWMDASEPDLLPGEPPTNYEDQQNYMGPTALGPAAAVMNAWPLMNSSAVYLGQREAKPEQRVFILTRSGFAGEQRYGTATWSGDVTSTWTALARQIPAGLGMSLSGVPYWTTDTAGYTMQQKFALKSESDPQAGAANAADEEEFRELNARWFEFSTFSPLLRVHGEMRPREMWLFGDQTPVYKTEVKFDDIRYALMPYIYSLAGAATQHGGTLMRPLVMDFPADIYARTLTDEYSFGPALLVAPVLHYKQRSREVYLPGSTPWFNLWTGASVPAGTVNADAPYDAMPVFVRAGAIVPQAPVTQYTGEHPDAEVTLHIFAGADGSFTLYEDDGKTFAYEHGAFSEVPLRWNDSSRTLTIGARHGSFPGIQAHRRFAIVLTSAASPVPFSVTPQALKTVEYDGSALHIQLP